MIRLLILMLLSMPVQADAIVAMCDDFNSFFADINNVSTEEEIEALNVFLANLNALSGDRFIQNPANNTAIIVLAKLNPVLAPFTEHPCATITSYAEIFGTQVQQVDVDGNPVFNVTQEQYQPEPYLPDPQPIYEFTDPPTIDDITGEEVMVLTGYTEPDPETDMITPPPVTYDVQTPVCEPISGGDPALLALYQSIYQYQNLTDENGDPVPDRSQFAVTFGPETRKSVYQCE